MENEVTINFQYIFEDNYNPVYVNGVYGGIGPHGEIIANFFLERMPLPKKLEHSLNEDGTLKDEISCQPENLRANVVRYVPTGIVLNKQFARQLCDWLQNWLEGTEGAKDEHDDAGVSSADTEQK